MTLTAPASEVTTPLWAVGLTIEAFQLSGLSSVTEFDVSCVAHVLPEGLAPLPLLPQSEAWEAGHRLGAALGHLVRGILR